MKAILILVAAAMVALSASGQDTTKTKTKAKKDNGYCAQYRNNKVVIVKQNAVINSEVTLADGITLGPDAILKKPDGTKVLMTVGECVDQNGNVEIAGKR